ncbi:MAG: hypothetical protein JWO08_2863 [Verrucomicrobiaceae bacterium]|nr:hypothetical protein [Verrucomicrobiaceae bacterium]
MHTLMLLFDWLLAASARASLLAAVVLIAQAVLRHRLPARWRHALWLPVLIVLLMPAFPESSWSVSSITRRAPAPLLEHLVIELNATPPAPSSLAVAVGKSGPAPWRQLLCLVWLSGAAGMMFFGLAAFVQTLWLFKRSRVPVSKEVMRELAAVAREIGLHHVPHVCMASAIHSPAVTGLLRPTLLLPAHFERTLAPHEMRLVLKHELTHIKRGDLPLNALLCLLLALHWFNPLLWLAFFKERLDREASCDAQVLDREDLAQRLAYGHTLLKVETAFSHHGLNLGFVGIFQRGTALRSRIQSIASPPNHHPLMKTVLVAVIMLLTFFGITKAVAPDPALPQILTQTKFVQITTLASGASGAAPLPALFDVPRKVPGLVGTLTDPEFQVIIRSLSQRKGTDLMSAPSVTAKSGQHATVEVLREFAYKDEAGKPAVRNTGVTFGVLAKIRRDDLLDLDLYPQIVEVDSMMNLGNGREKPVFKERKATVSAAMTAGQTIVLEMEPRTDKQLVQETDEAGHIISTRTDVYSSRMLVFVTAYLVDPVTGKTLASTHAAAKK